MNASVVITKLQNKVLLACCSVLLYLVRSLQYTSVLYSIFCTKWKASNGIQGRPDVRHRVQIQKLIKTCWCSYENTCSCLLICVINFEVCEKVWYSSLISRGQDQNWNGKPFCVRLNWEQFSPIYSWDGSGNWNLNITNLLITIAHATWRFRSLLLWTQLYTSRKAFKKNSFLSEIAVRNDGTVHIRNASTLLKRYCTVTVPIYSTVLGQ